VAVEDEARLLDQGDAVSFPVGPGSLGGHPVRAIRKGSNALPRPGLHPVAIAHPVAEARRVTVDGEPADLGVGDSHRLQEVLGSRTTDDGAPEFVITDPGREEIVEVAVETKGDGAHDDEDGRFSLRSPRRAVFPVGPLGRF
jgi:hypothetical protein